MHRFEWRWVGAVAAASAVLLTALSGRYGYHRDELYFLVAGAHPAAGYVDQPPLTPLLARFSATVFGNSPTGLRVVATLAGVAAVLLVALVAREFGGGRVAQVVAAACTATSAYVLVVSHMVSTASFDLVAWIAVCWALLRLLRSGDRRLWLAVGAFTGAALENKDLVVLLVACIGVVLLAVGPRDVLRTWWLPAGVVLALLVTAPNLVWQAEHGWPQLTVASGISAEDGTENRIMFIPLQLLYLSPAYVPLWIVGLASLWRNQALRWARAFGLAYPLLAAVVLVLGGKAYYTMPLLLVVLAAGVEPVVAWLRRGREHWQLRELWIALTATAVVSTVVGLPVLPPDRLGAVLAVNREQGEQVGWPRLVRTVSSVWQEVPPTKRETAVIFTANYGEAGAIARYGPVLGLPQPYSGHMSFAAWGPPPDGRTGPVVLVAEAGDRAITAAFTGCRVAAHNDNGVGIDNEEQGAVVRLCAAPRKPWSRLWPSLRHYY
ncbi:MAG: ArnT family glycosyltransferase [Streptosporangiales bacterium]